jgi:SAM-dependent methyltransferase
MEKKYFDMNRDSWNQRTLVHEKSKFYDLESFRKGRCSLMPIEREELGDVRGKDLLHLQCHFGQDTLSLQRSGAKCVGVDFSDEAIGLARNLNQELGLDARFVCSNVYDLEEKPVGKFDVVFTSYGVVGWLPDMDKWAEIISRHTKPGGIFYMAEFHPVLEMFDDEMAQLKYGYFHENAPLIEEVKGTYTDAAEGEGDFKSTNCYWIHSLADITNALIRNGFRIEHLNEFDHSPYSCFENMFEVEPGKFQLKNHPGKIPMVFSIRARKV